MIHTHILLTCGARSQILAILLILAKLNFFLWTNFIHICHAANALTFLCSDKHAPPQFLGDDQAIGTIPAVAGAIASTLLPVLATSVSRSDYM